MVINQKLFQYFDIQPHFGYVNTKKQKVNLSDCCNAITGKQLDKRHTISLWDRANLSDDQIKYAALDAHILLNMFQHLADNNRLPDDIVNYYNDLHKSDVNFKPLELNGLPLEIEINKINGKKRNKKNFNKQFITSHQIQKANNLNSDPIYDDASGFYIF